MADQHKKTRSESSPGRAKPSPGDEGSTDGQVPEPGVSLDIETLGGATAGATDPTIKVRINLSLDDAD
jgi:hypothetical protein